MKSLNCITEARLILVSVLLAVTSTNSYSIEVPIDQVPMYGGLDRSSQPSLLAADEKLVADATRHFGSREKASAAFVQNAFSLYGKDDLAGAMRRFNQAWILNPENPDAHYGFAVVLHDQGKYCDAAAQFEKAQSLPNCSSDMVPDFARVIVMCAANDASLSPEEKSARFARADTLYAEALKTFPDKGYVYASQASSMYYQGQCERSWELVKKAQQAGAEIPKVFLDMLRAKCPEPR